jgi:hypothetical protein
MSREEIVRTNDDRKLPAFRRGCRELACRTVEGKENHAIPPRLAMNKNPNGKFRFSSVFALLFLLICLASKLAAQEITKPTEIEITYWHAFKGETIHGIHLQESGAYSLFTTFSDSSQKYKASREAQKPLTAEDLQPLLTFSNNPATREAFAHSQMEFIADGDSLRVTIRQNKFVVNFLTQPCLEDTNTPAERKLVGIVSDLLRKTELHLSEPLDWLDILTGNENIDAVGWSGLLKAIQGLHDAQGKLIPFAVYLLGKPDEKKALKISAEHRRAREILHDIGESFGITFSVYHGIAVFGTSEELRRFDEAISASPPLDWKSAAVVIPRMIVDDASVGQTTDFLNHKLREQNMNDVQIECLAHADHRVNFTGNEVSIAGIVSIIAADAGERVFEVFVEKRKAP